MARNLHTVKFLASRNLYNGKVTRSRDPWQIANTMKYRIKEHRRARRLTQAQLAEMAGLSSGYISLLESGERDASAEALRSLAAALRVDVTEMIVPDSSSAQRLVDHLSVFQRLSPEDQEAIYRIALRMLPDSEK